MNDKQMLEMAAKAAGYECATQCDGSPMVIFENSQAHDWNPLTDDGDALRLAVKLRIEFYIADSDGFASYAGYPHVNGATRYASEWHDDTNAEAATRRAIVRAAAEIGRAL